MKYFASPAVQVLIVDDKRGCLTLREWHATIHPAILLTGNGAADLSELFGKAQLAHELAGDGVEPQSLQHTAATSSCTYDKP